MTCSSRRASQLSRSSCSLFPPSHPTMSSSPLHIPSSDLDAEMEDATQPQTPGAEGQSLSQAPPPQHLFFEGTPSASGTPSRPPFGSAVARRALGTSTPRRRGTPLFAREFLCPIFSPLLITSLPYFSAGSSSPAHYPSSSPAKNARAAYRRPQGASSIAGSNMDSEPLDFPS